MTLLIRLWLLGSLLIGGGALAAPLDGAATYDLLFRGGTLDQIDHEDALVYRRDVTNALKPEAAERDSGIVALSFKTTSDDKLMAQLQLQKDEKYRSLGVFPASVGNPMIMYFYETVVRDMAEAAGGSPFYIRSRVKEALVQTSDVETGSAVVDGQTVETRIVRMYPFANDPNSERMQGFGNLELRVTMSEAVPGWYVSLVADTTSADGTDSVYRSELRFDRLETPQ